MAATIRTSATGSAIQAFGTKPAKIYATKETAATEHAVDKPPLTRMAAEGHRLTDGGMGGDVHIKKLIKPHPQKRAGMGIERGGRAPRQCTDVIIKRQRALDRAVKEGKKQSTLAPFHCGKAVFVGNKIGIAPLGLKPQKERKRTAARVVSHAAAPRH